MFRHRTVRRIRPSDQAGIPLDRIHRVSISLDSAVGVFGLRPIGFEGVPVEGVDIAADPIVDDGKLGRSPVHVHQFLADGREVSRTVLGDRLHFARWAGRGGVLVTEVLAAIRADLHRHARVAGAVDFHVVHAIDRMPIPEGDGSTAVDGAGVLPLQG